MGRCSYSEGRESISNSEGTPEKIIYKANKNNRDMNSQNVNGCRSMPHYMKNMRLR